MLLWSSAGFLIANVLVTLPCFLVLAFGDRLGVHDDDPIHETIGIVAGIGILVGPIVASILGFGAGVWVGLWRAARAVGQVRS